MNMAVLETVKYVQKPIARFFLPFKIKCIESGALTKTLYSFSISYTEDEIKNMPSANRRQLMQKLAEKLKKKEISEVFVPDFILNLPEADILRNTVYIPDGISIMRALSARFVISYIKKRALSPKDTHICIYSPEFSDEERTLCQKLLPFTKDICLASENTKSAALTADSIYDTSGLSCSVSSVPPSDDRYNIFVLFGKCSAALPEKAYIFDAAKNSKPGCKNTINLVFPFNMSSIASHFSEKNQSCAEFILSCCSMKDKISKSPEDALSFIGCEIKSITCKKT